MSDKTSSLLARLENATDKGPWYEGTAGERIAVRLSSTDTNGAYAIVESLSRLSLYSELLERLSVRRRFKRQPHIKLCAIRTCAEVNFAVMAFDDDPVADNQAESRA